MSSQLLLLLKFSLLALLYLFLVRVVRAVWAEVASPVSGDLPPPGSPAPRAAMPIAAGVGDPSERLRGVPKSTPPTGAVAAVGTVGAVGAMGLAPDRSVGGDGPARVVVVAPAGLAGHAVEVGADGVLVGRGAGCDLVVEDSYVSQQHLRISEAGPGRWWVEDLGSTNGTFVAGSRLVAPQQVGRGEPVGLGGVVVELR